MPTGNYGPGYPAVVAQTVAPTTAVGSAGAVQEPVSQIEGGSVGTVTITGTVGAGPTVTVNIGNRPVPYTYVSGDTTTTLAAQHIAAAINADAVASTLVTASNNANVVKLVSKTNGAAGMYSLSTVVTGGAVATASGSELDLANNLVVPLQTGPVNLPGGGGAITLYAGVPITVDPATKTYLRSQGLIA